MKKATIARFVIGGAAIFAAFGLAACGAESGQGAEGIGETSEALTACSNPAPTTLTTEQRELTQGCTIADTATGTSYFVYAGGKTAAGVIKDEIYTSANGAAYTLATAKLGVARYDITAYKLNSTTCVFAAGLTAAATPSKKVDSVVVTNGVPVVTNEPDLAVARSLPLVSDCSGAIMVTGGLDAASNGLKSIEVRAGAGWNSKAAALPKGVGLTMIAKNPSANKYAIAGGRDDTGNKFATVLGINASSCDPNNAGFVVTDVTNVSTGNSAVLNNTVEGLVGFYESTTTGVDRFIFTAGRKTGAALYDKADHIDIDWGTLANSTTVSRDNVTVGFRPTFVPVATNHVILLGGSDAGETTSIVVAKEYNAGWAATCSVSTGHYLAPAGLLGGVAYIPGGRVLGTGVTAKVDTAQ